MGLSAYASEPFRESIKALSSSGVVRHDRDRPTLTVTAIERTISKAVIGPTSTSPKLFGATVKLPTHGPIATVNAAQKEPFRFSRDNESVMKTKQTANPLPHFWIRAFGSGYEMNDYFASKGCVSTEDSVKGRMQFCIEMCRE